MPERPYTPLLDALAYQGIISVMRGSDGIFRIREGRGGTYTEFTEQQITELAGELISLACVSIT